jgi:N-acetylglucosaminyldiphosphoundecaprenol N-acetyl-beta-D-mannosaminyltransferase
MHFAFKLRWHLAGASVASLAWHLDMLDSTPLVQIKRISVLGTPVACVTYDSALAIVEQLAREQRATAVCPANTHILAEARHDPNFGRVMKKFDLVFPDGMPVVWALNLSGAGLSDRVYGPYFTRHALKQTPRPWRHFFFGDTEQVLEDLKRVAVQLQPSIDIVGAISPPFRAWTESDEAQFAETINRVNPDFVWVALPGGRMERWIIDNQHRYHRGVFLAVGDAFTLLSGRRPFAPKWMQRLGLTWLYRMIAEPRRLGPRYLRYNSLFVCYLVRDWLFGPPAAGRVG